MAKNNALYMKKEETQKTDKLELPNSNTSVEDIENIKMQMKVISQGVVVDVVDVLSADEFSNGCTVKLKVLTNAGIVPMFSDVKLKIANQALSKLWRELKRIAN